MSSSNRNSRSRRRSYERSNYGSNRQDTRFNDTPPRFASRRTNGEGVREPTWGDDKNSYQPRRENGGTRPGRSGNYDESSLNQILTKISQSSDLDKCVRIARQLQDFLDNAEQRACIQSTYDINGDQLRFYIHYHPSFYHLHVHITNLKYDSPGIMIGRAHLLDDVIDNIDTIDSQYYQKRKLSFVLKETHGLTSQYRGIQNQYNGRTT